MENGPLFNCFYANSPKSSIEIQKKIYMKISPKNAVSLRIPQKTRSFLSTSTQFIIMLLINETNSRANTKKRNETPTTTYIGIIVWQILAQKSQVQNSFATRCAAEFPCCCFFSFLLYLLLLSLWSRVHCLIVKWWSPN